MLLHPNQVEELLDIIKFHHIFFISTNVGKEVLSNEDKKVLKNFGVDLNKFKNSEGNYLNQAYKFGVLAEILGNKNATSLNYDDFKKYLTAAKYIPLTKIEEKSLESLKTQAYHDIKGLGNRISKDFTKTYIEVDQKRRSELEALIQKEAETTILNRETVKDMVLRLGHASEEWNRDLGRIAETLLHAAYEEGRANSIEEKQGKDASVYKDVYDGACRYCIKAYLTNGLGSEPIIFKLSELKANGNNHGRKPQDWKPVVGYMHPFCRCTLHYMDKDYIWNEKTRSFDILKPYQRKIERKSKIKYTVGDKHFEI